MPILSRFQFNHSLFPKREYMTCNTIQSLKNIAFQRDFIHGMTQIRGYSPGGGESERHGMSESTYSTLETFIPFLVAIYDEDKYIRQ